MRQSRSINAVLGGFRWSHEPPWSPCRLQVPPASAHTSAAGEGLSMCTDDCIPLDGLASLEQVCVSASKPNDLRLQQAAAMPSPQLCLCQPGAAAQDKGGPLRHPFGAAHNGTQNCVRCMRCLQSGSPKGWWWWWLESQEARSRQKPAALLLLAVGVALKAWQQGTAGAHSRDAFPSHSSRAQPPCASP